MHTHTRSVASDLLGKLAKKVRDELGLVQEVQRLSRAMAGVYVAAFFLAANASSEPERM